MYTKDKVGKLLNILQFETFYEHWQYHPNGRKSYYSWETLNAHNDAYINLIKSPIVVGENEI